MTYSPDVSWSLGTSDSVERLYMMRRDMLTESFAACRKPLAIQRFPALAEILHKFTRKTRRISDWYSVIGGSEFVLLGLGLIDLGLNGRCRIG